MCENRQCPEDSVCVIKKEGDRETASCVKGIPTDI